MAVKAKKEAAPKSVFTLLRERHPAPAWAFLEEVRNATGFSRQVRTTDAIAMSLFPSRGLHLHAFEVKVSRSDWVRELRDPAKQEEIAAYCHYFWLVVDDGAIVRDGELPVTWGLLERRGDRLVAVKQPNLSPEAQPPTWRFLAAIFRKFAGEEATAAQIENARAEGYQRGKDEGYRQGVERTSDGHWQKAYEKANAQIEAFQRVSGVNLHHYELGQIGHVVKLLAGGWDSPIAGLERMAKDAEEIAQKTREAVVEMRKRLPELAKEEA